MDFFFSYILKSHQWILNIYTPPWIFISPPGVSRPTAGKYLNREDTNREANQEPIIGVLSKKVLLHWEGGWIRWLPFSATAKECWTPNQHHSWFLSDHRWVSGQREASELTEVSLGQWFPKCVPEPAGAAVSPGKLVINTHSQAHPQTPWIRNSGDVANLLNITLRNSEAQ